MPVHPKWDTGLINVQPTSTPTKTATPTEIGAVPARPVHLPLAQR